MLNFTPLDKEKFFEPNYLKKPATQNERADFEKVLYTYFKERDDRLNKEPSEENLKNALYDFFRTLKFQAQLGMKQSEVSKASSTTDLALIYDKVPQVLIEVKIPNKKTMFSPTNTNCEALWESILYYLRHRDGDENLLTTTNSSIKFIIITDCVHFYFFKAKDYEELFARNNDIKQHFKNYKDPNSIFAGKINPFYEELEKTFNKANINLQGFHLNISDTKDEALFEIAFKLFHKDFLFSLFNPKDANEINEKFYAGLLKTLGLKAVEDEQGKKIIIIPSSEKDTLYHAIKLTLENKNKLTNDEDKDYENAMSLIILWLNRILFLKLVEANLKRFNKGDKHSFLNSDKIKSCYDLNKLFFNVFAKDFTQRDDTKSPEFKLPYLNSSLFEPQKCENDLCFISELSQKPLIALLDFLNKHDFSSGDENAKAEDIINASILGKIFERFNGYKDGSVFTKSFVTSYMCKNAIEKVVLTKFNELNSAWKCQSLKNIKDEILNEIRDDRQNETSIKAKYKGLLNSIRICDPAVGSGHFLVSALNEMVRVYYELGLSELEIMDLRLENDEIIITTNENKIFEYKRPHSPQEKEHKIQKALFELKKDIIENNLFGVDINPNSVEICKLRLWIELLKNSYYLQKDDENFNENLDYECHQLQTLPNIDINIKCGNSLLNIIATQDSENIENSVKWHKQHNKEFSNNFKAQISKYNALVQEYKDRVGKKDDLRVQMQQIKENLRQMLYLQPLKDKFNKEFNNFVNVKKYDTQDLNDDLQRQAELIQGSGFFDKELKKQKPSKAEINKIHKLWQDLEQNLQSKQDSIEWRYEFPEILNLSSNDDKNFGDFVGFDLIIGNPPYINVKDGQAQKDRLEAAYGFFDDTYTHFFFKAYELLKPNGVLSLITPTTFWTIKTKAVLRKFILQTHLNSISYTANPFDKVAVDTCITELCKKPQEPNATISFIDGSNGFENAPHYEASKSVYTTSGIFFKPSPYNLSINQALGSKVAELKAKWFDKIENSKKITKHKAELENYRTSLKAGDLTLLGLITTGGQGLATADNGKYVGVLSGTPQATDTIKKRAKALFEAKAVWADLGINFSNLKAAQDFLDTLNEKQVQELFTNARTKHGRHIFGKGFIYRIITQNELADLATLSDTQKANGIEGAKCFVPYDKGDKDGNRWFLPTPYYIEWSVENVRFLKENSGKKGEGMPVVRNPQFYFREGFCWNNILNERSVLIKARLKGASVNDVAAMSLYTQTDLPNSFFVALLNSRLIFDYQRTFINSTSAIQINDIRQIPIIIPSPEQLRAFEALFDEAYAAQRAKFERGIDSTEILKSVQERLDTAVYELYGLNKNEHSYGKD